ncbi:MAG: SWIM zinc finger family protein, partial [Verrucomicrobiota bacterium]
MLFQYRYSGTSQITSNASSSGMTFAPDTYRQPTYFIGNLRKKVAFREAISALHDVVVSDLRFQPKDKSDYKRWAAEQEEAWLGEALSEVEEVATRVRELRSGLSAMNKERSTIMKPFYEAQRKYFAHLYKQNRDWWFVLDPVITVHPNELFFECFSVDESSYGRLGCNYEVFEKVNEFSCGTTNVDYSDLLYNEFQKIRDYKETQFTVDPSGFEVETTNEEQYKEVKIDLPDSWVRGFLQVSSAMTFPGYTFDLHPMDLHNFCFVLRRMKEKQ